MTSHSKPAFTAGPARVVRDHPSNACTSVKGVTGCELATLYGGWLDSPDRASRIAERDANAELIAEAFTVAHETGLTPRQLAEQRDLLLVTMRHIARQWPDSFAANHARTALAETTGGVSND